MKDKLKKIESKLPDIWLWFTYVLIILGALAVVVSLLVSFYQYVSYDDDSFALFLYFLAGFVGLLIPCSIIQLLVILTRKKDKE